MFEARRRMGGHLIEKDKLENMKDRTFSRVKGNNKEGEPILMPLREAIVSVEDVEKGGFQKRDVLRRVHQT